MSSPDKCYPEKLTRRELLALLLGTPALISGCASAPQLPPAGELFGQSFEIGHKIRDGFHPRPAAADWQEKKVVIVGGGAAGLAAAWRLRRAGMDDFVVLELEPVAGGTSRSGSSDVTRYPWAAHYLPVPFGENQTLIELLREMDVVESLEKDGAPVIREQDLCRDPEERLFFQGEWIEGLYPATDATEQDLAELAAFRREIDRWVGWRDGAGRKAFSIPTSAASPAEEVRRLDQLTMGDWLRQQGWKSERLHWLVDYSCRDDYGLSAEETSAWAGILYFAARQKAAGSDHQPLMTWPEGNGRLIRHLVDSVGERIVTGVAVTSVKAGGTSDSKLAEVVYYDVKRQQGAEIRAQHVIYAAPQFVAPRLIEGFTERFHRHVDQFQYGSWLVANLHLSNRPKELDYSLCWDNVIHGSKSLGYVVATHQTGRDHGPTVLTWYYPYSSQPTDVIRRQLLQATWADLADVALTDLEQAHPDIRNLTQRLDLFRWGHAMIRPKPGFITSPQRLAAQQPVGNIHFANTDLSGIALFEEAFDHGCRAAKECLEAMS